MATNWTVLTGNDLSQVLSRKIITDADEDTADGVLPGQTLDPSSTTNRSAVLLAKAVAEVRGAVRLAGKTALAVTASSVPPELADTTLYLAAWRLVNSTPNLNAALFNEGMRAGLKGLYDEACKRIEGVRQGNNTTPPSDPTGQDYETAVDDDADSATYNPALDGAVVWGDMEAEDTEYYAGEAVDPTTGATTQLPVDMTIG